MLRRAADAERHAFRHYATTPLLRHADDIIRYAEDDEPPHFRCHDAATPLRAIDAATFSCYAITLIFRYAMPRARYAATLISLRYCHMMLPMRFLPPPRFAAFLRHD